MLKKIAFTMYPVEDMQRARNFYEKILGLSVGATTADGAWVEYDLPGGGCFAITTLAKGLKPGLDMGGRVAFEVDNLLELLSDLKSKLVQVKLDIFSSPVCKLAIIMDSEGNAVILHELHKKK
jgi:predicted enzyme related to lactoylglutathione lyase